MNETFFQTIIVIIVFLLGLYLLQALKSKFKKNFNFRVLTALVIGLAFGGIIQLIFGADSSVTSESTTFMGIFSTIYINLLQLIVIPLILVSISTAIINAGATAKLGKKIAQVIGVLIFTVIIAAGIGVATMHFIPIDPVALTENANEDASAVEAKEEKLKEKEASVNDTTYADFITAPFTTNFSFLVGIGDTAALSTVLFGSFLGYATLQVKRRKEEKVKTFVDFLESSKEVILSMVREILKLTPFGIFALMTSFAASSSLLSLSELGKFLLASYVAMIIMFIIHLIMIALQGINPFMYFKKVWPVLLFGFGSRSSMASIPMNVETQVDELGVDESSANLSASFGATIGQNGCAGIYPAMVAVLAAQVAGIEMTFSWMIVLVVVIAISSFGIAGVGGGATFAAIAVLSIMGLPIEIVAVLVAIEPLIDMARTALNISDSIVAGVTVADMNGTLDRNVLNSESTSTK